MKYWSVAPLAAFATLLSIGAASQTPPAPVLATTLDTDGRPLPFGRRPHEPNDKPLGSGRFPAVMAE